MQITVSFYARFDEIQAWLAAYPHVNTLSFALAGGQPYRIAPVAKFQDLSAEDCVGWRWLWIDTSPFEAVVGQLEASGRYHDRLELDFPYMHDGFLREGGLGTLSEDPIRLKRWRSLIRYVRSRTTSGMWVRNPDTGAKGLYKHLRYSPGVRELCSGGLQLKPVGGENLVSIDEP